MKKLKTRDEIIEILESSGYFYKVSDPQQKEMEEVLCSAVDHLIRHDIIEVAEDEVPGWGDIYATLQEIIENDDNDTSIRMKLSTALKNIKKLNKD